MPIPDYRFNIPRPTERLLSGIQTGLGISQVIEQRRQLQAAQDRQTRVDETLSSFRAVENPAFSDYQKVITLMPKERADQLTKEWGLLSKEQQTNQLKFSGQVMAAFNANPEIAISMLEKRAESERNAGDEDEAAQYEQWAQIAKAKPEAVQENIGMIIAALPGGKDVIDSVSALRKAEREEGVSIDPVQSSEILPDGTVQLVRKLGGIEIVPPTEADALLIKEAREFGASLKGLGSAEQEAAKAAIKLSTDAFTKLQPIEKNIENLNKGIRLIDEGAATGAITKFFPSFRRASVELDNLQAQLGLDVLSNTTFGALSEKELAFALSTALPQKLKGEPLKSWLRDKRDAQQKLSNYLRKTAVFLGTPGNTVADFINQQKETGVETEAPTAIAPQQVGRFTIEVIE